MRCRLAPLSEEQVSEYIARRMEVAGARQAGNIFPSPAVALIFQYSKGLPRLINSICDSALITAYARQIRSITAEIIEQVAIDSRLNVEPEPALPGKAAGDDHALKNLFTLIHLLEKEEHRDQIAQLVKKSVGGL
jgi:hypothetical protein